MNNYIMHLASPCRGCPRRTAVPNCHDEKTCEDWRDYKAALRKGVRDNSVDEAYLVRRQTANRLRAAADAHKRNG